MVLVLVLTLLAGAAGAEMKILASFYPVYILTLNLTQGVPGVTVENLVPATTGCLHDYSLQTRDMARIEKADVLVINGGGMEQFMDRVAGVSGLAVIEAAAGIPMTDSSEEGFLNSHVWMDPALAAREAENIAAGLEAADPENAKAYRDNLEDLKGRLASLDGEIREMLRPFEGREIVIFHEAMTYFAQAYGLKVAGIIATEPGEEPSTRDIARTCDMVKRLGIRELFTEPQYPQTAAQTIARETGARIYVLDPVVSGDGTPGSYEAALREDARVLKEALGGE